MEKGYADVVLTDVVDGLPQGKALDILQSAHVLKFSSQLTGTNDYAETADSDVVIITAGLARKPGMTRDELVLANMKVITEVTRNVIKYSPDAVIIMVTNPSDAMTQLALKVSQLSRNRVFGLSGVLDGARFGSFIAAELKVSVTDVSTCVMGQHGNDMLVIPRLSTVNGISLTELLPPDKIEELVERTIKGGAEIVELLKTGSAFYAPAASALQMAEAVIFDQKRVLNCATYLEGEYNINDTVIGVPVKLGRNGIEQIIELEMTEEEKAALTRAATTVQGLIKVMKL